MASLYLSVCIQRRLGACEEAPRRRGFGYSGNVCVCVWEGGGGCMCVYALLCVCVCAHVVNGVSYFIPKTKYEYKMSLVTLSISGTADAVTASN